jgi:hypothetical protein
MKMKRVYLKSATIAVLGLIALLSYEWSGLVQPANAIPAFAPQI